jgi:hypothetical protein
MIDAEESSKLKLIMGRSSPAHYPNFIETLLAGFQ